MNALPLDAEGDGRRFGFADELAVVSGLAQLLEGLDEPVDVDQATVQTVGAVGALKAVAGIVSVDGQEAVGCVVKQADHAVEVPLDVGFVGNAVLELLCFLNIISMLNAVHIRHSLYPFLERCALFPATQVEIVPSASLHSPCVAPILPIVSQNAINVNSLSPFEALML